MSDWATEEAKAVLIRNKFISDDNLVLEMLAQALRENRAKTLGDNKIQEVINCIKDLCDGFDDLNRAMEDLERII